MKVFLVQWHYRGKGPNQDGFVGAYKTYEGAVNNGRDFMENFSGELADNVAYTITEMEVND